MALTKVRGNTQIKSGTITNVEISANAGIELSKLAEGAELLKRDGSVALTGDLNLDGNKLINVGAPVSDNDAARKVDLDSAVSSIQSDLDIVDNRLDTAEGDIVALEGRMDTAESDIAALEAADVVIDGRLDTAESDIVALEGRMDTAEGDIDALEGRMDTAEGDIDALEAADVVIDGRLDTAEGDIVALEGRMDTAESDIVSLEGRMDSVESKNVEQDGRLDTAEGDIDALEGRMDTAEVDIDALQAEDIALDGRLDVVEAKNIEQDGRLDTAESDIVALEGRMDTAEGDIDALQAEDIALDGRLDVVEAKNVEQDGRLDDLEAADVALDIRLDDVEADLAQEILDRQAGVQEAKDYADQKVADLVNGAPAVLDTLKELADALGNDENFATTIAGQIGDLDSRLDTAESDIAALEAADVVLDGRLDVAEADINNLESDLGALDSAVVKIANVITRESPEGAIDGSNKIFNLAFSPVLGTESVFLNGLLQEPNSSSTITVTDIDWEVGSGGDFATLSDALASASVLSGDNILIKSGTYSVSSTINISKGVRIFGENRDAVIFETAGASGDPVSMFNVSVNDVVMKDLTIKHKKTSNTSVETAVVVSGPGFPQTRVSGFMMDNCVVEFVEFAVTVRGSAWKIVNSTLYYTGPSNSTRRAIGVYGTLGDCFVKGNSIKDNAATGNLRFLALTTTTGTNPNETYEGKLIVEDNIQVLGPLQQFISQDSFQGSANNFEMIIKNNNVNETSAFVSFYGVAANFGNIFSQITLSGNTLSNNHGSGGGKGAIGIDGAGSGLAFRSSALPVHSSGNTLSNLVFRTGYAEASGSSGSIVGYSTTPIAQPSVTLDSVIGASPSAPATPESSSTSTVVVENDYAISADVITFNDAPVSGDRIRVSYIK